MARYYYAEKEDATVTINSFNATGSEISANIAHNGTPKIGYVTIDANGVPNFIEGDMPAGVASTAKEMLKKHKFAFYLKVNATPAKFIRIRKATEFTRNMNPSTEEYDYIADEHPTTEVTDYKPSDDMVVKTIKGEPDFELFYQLYKKRAIGTDAHREVLSVFMFDYVDVGVDAATPVFTNTLEDVSYDTSDTASALNGTATISDGGVLSYQWYTVNDGVDTAISGATSASYTPDISEAGVTTYKVVATNTNNSATGEKVVTASQTVTVTVTEA